MDEKKYYTIYYGRPIRITWIDKKEKQMEGILINLSKRNDLINIQFKSNIEMEALWTTCPEKISKIEVELNHNFWDHVTSIIRGLFCMQVDKYIEI